jgi:hypothetical protein
MQMSENGFEQIMSALLEQKQVWERLQVENRELRQQLVDLRAGRGIAVEIQNQRFELVWVPARTILEAKTVPEIAEAAQGKRPQVTRTIKAAPPSPTLASAGVLEEMLLDELSSAMNKRMGSEGKPSLNEEQMADLRRELSGSFLLE